MFFWFVYQTAVNVFFNGSVDTSTVTCYCFKIVGQPLWSFSAGRMYNAFLSCIKNKQNMFTVELILIMY